MPEPQIPEKLRSFVPSGRTYSGEHRILFGIDSDGCVDTGMRKKHTNPGPFAYAGIETYDLQSIAASWRIAWTYVNEFKDRGCPRFEALPQVADLVLQMPEVRTQERLIRVNVPRFPHLKRYNKIVLKTKGAGDNVLAEYIEGLQQSREQIEELLELEKVAQWSKKVNQAVNEMCPYIPPFENAVHAIEQAYNSGIDIMIVSGTPEEHLRRQWKQHGLIDKVQGVFGRDTANKDMLLYGAIEIARQQGKPYDFVMMFGDAPGDNKARIKASELASLRIGFFPIRAGLEEQDWAHFTINYLRDRIPDDYDLGYGTEEEKRRIADFEANLDVPWNPDLDLTGLFTKK